MDLRLEKIMSFDNKMVEPSIISRPQIETLVHGLLNVIDDGIEGDVVEFGCFVGESSKYLMKTLVETNSNKSLYVYDSFEGLPDLTKWEEGSGWRPGTLKTTEDVLISNFTENNLPVPTIHKDWFSNVPEDKIPEKISFAFLDGDFYNSIYDSLSKIYDKVSDGGYIFFHDFRRPDLPGVDAAIKDFLSERGIEYNVIEVTDQVGLLIKNNPNPIKEEIFKTPDMFEPNNNMTIVTGLWNVGRPNRSFEHYLEHFMNFLEIPQNLFIYIPKEYEHLVWEKRSKKNTFVKVYELQDIRNLYDPFWDKTQEIRNNPDWRNLAGWLPDSPQASMEWYNPIVQSKMFMLNDASIWNPFDTEYLFWLDAGITNTVPTSHLVENNVLDKLTDFGNPFIFLSYPYEANNEIHGFEIGSMNSYSGEEVKYVCRGGLFGGHKDQIHEANVSYYSTLNRSLNSNLMGTEESIFTIMSYNDSHIYKRFELDSNGLVVKFTQSIIDGDTSFKTTEIKKPQSNIIKVTDRDVEKYKTNLYMLTFNFPEQVQHTINSMKKTPEWLEKPNLILLDNSTNEEARNGNRKIAEENNFEYISLEGNTGICGGRQFAAEHFHESDADFMFFFEDDMTSNPPEFKGEVCRNGFSKYISNLYNIVHKIMLRDNFDFLKLTFTEVYFDNDKQCSWYNIPQEIRTRDWPDYDRLPVSGLDPNVPLTNFNNIRVMNGVSYIDGEVYYANWPMIVSKEGNKKMFIDTKWGNPFEQTWMSHNYQLTKEGKLKPAVLLASPILHDRIKHYEAKDRREN